MKKLFSTILTILSLISYSQNIKQSPKNEALALQKYRGGYNVDEIIDYELVNNRWVIKKSDVGILFYSGRTVYFKRNQGQWMQRELNFINYNPTLKAYCYRSQYGNTFINKDFKTITFFDAENKNKKYEYHIGIFDSSIIVKNSVSNVEIKENQTKPSFSQQSLSLDNSIMYKNYVIKPTWDNLTLLLFTDMGSFKTMMNKYNYSLTTDGSAYIANTEIGSPYFTIGKSTDEINMIFTYENNLITTFRTELRQKLKGGNVSFEKGFEVYRVQYNNEGFNYRIKIAIKQDPDGSGMVLLTLQ